MEHGYQLTKMAATQVLALQQHQQHYLLDNKDQFYNIKVYFCMWQCKRVDISCGCETLHVRIDVSFKGNLRSALFIL